MNSMHSMENIANQVLSTDERKILWFGSDSNFIEMVKKTFESSRISNEKRESNRTLSYIPTYEIFDSCLCVLSPCRLICGMVEYANSHGAHGSVNDIIAVYRMVGIFHSVGYANTFRWFERHFFFWHVWEMLVNWFYHILAPIPLPPP